MRPGCDRILDRQLSGALSGRKDRRTFERSYTAADPETMLAVVMAGRAEKRLEPVTSWLKSCHRIEAAIVHAVVVVSRDGRI